MTVLGAPEHVRRAMVSITGAPMRVVVPREIVVEPIEPASVAIESVAPAKRAETYEHVWCSNEASCPYTAFDCYFHPFPGPLTDWDDPAGQKN